MAYDILTQLCSSDILLSGSDRHLDCSSLPTPAHSADAGVQIQHERYVKGLWQESVLRPLEGMQRRFPVAVQVMELRPLGRYCPLCRRQCMLGYAGVPGAQARIPLPTFAQAAQVRVRSSL